MNSIATVFNGLSIKQRVSTALVAVAVGAGVLGMAHVRRESDFRQLYTSMTPGDAATVVQKLKESGVEYRLDDTGGSVSVPSAKLGESRLALAAAGLPKSGRIGFELFDKTDFGQTDFVEHINYQRALEGELERSVMSLAEVEQARVHLTLPKESVFLDEQQPAKASVIVKLRPSAQISQQNVLAVTNLVASAVPGLVPGAVSVVDMDGRLLNRARPEGTGDDEAAAQSLEFRQELEHSLVTKINQTLEPLLGADGFRAAASVDCDLTSGDQQEEVLDPAKSVIASSQKTEDTSERDSAGGVPGTASNLPAPPAPVAKAGSGTSHRTENTTYETSRVVRHTKIPQGVIRRMSLAVLVDQKAHWEGSGAQKQRVLTPPSPEILQTIKDLVAGVTGLSVDRGDQLIVETLPFESSLNAAPPDSVKSPPPPAAAPGPPWLKYLSKYRAYWVAGALGLVVLFVLARVVAAMGRKPSVQVASAPEALPAPEGASLPLVSPEAEGGRIPPPKVARPKDERAVLVESAREIARTNPAATATVVRMWIQEPRS
jgi:flagellar M-ring protein FliF